MYSASSIGLYQSIGPRVQVANPMLTSEVRAASKFVQKLIQFLRFRNAKNATHFRSYFTQFLYEFLLFKNAVISEDIIANLCSSLYEQPPKVRAASEARPASKNCTKIDCNIAIYFRSRFCSIMYKLLFFEAVGGYHNSLCRKQSSLCEHSQNSEPLQKITICTNRDCVCI